MQNVYTANIALKCNERVKKSSTKNKHLQTVEASPQRQLNKYGEFHNLIMSYYKILESPETFIGHYLLQIFSCGISFEKLLKVYRFYPESYTELQIG